MKAFGEQTGVPAAGSMVVPRIAGAKASISTNGLASRTQIRALLLGLLFVGGLLAFEIVHYLVATNLGAGDHAEAAAAIHPQCKEMGNRFELLCPIAGYNSVRLQCLASDCGARDPNFPNTTDALRAKNATMYRTDSIASLRVEAPYSAETPEWRDWASDLRADQISVPAHVDMNKPPQRLEEAWRIVQQRSLLISEQAAQEYLAEHAK